MSDSKKLDGEARAVRAAYFRDWRKRNPEKVRENNRRYWERRAERMKKEAEQHGDR